MNIHYSDVPAGYEHCLSQHCPKAETCLHRIAAQRAADADVESFTAYNPATLGEDGSCKHYRSSSPIQVKRGMSTFFDALPHKASIGLRRTLEVHYGHTQFHRIRHGQLDITPQMQAYIQHQLTELGIESSPAYDEEAERVDW